MTIHQITAATASGAPDLDAVKAYLGASSTYEDSEVASALAAEAAAQAKACTIPDGDFPEDLAEALKRRVAVNLANRALPLGISASISEAFVATSRVGGLDREVRRLEAPFRKLIPA